MRTLRFVPFYLLLGSALAATAGTAIYLSDKLPDSASFETSAFLIWLIFLTLVLCIPGLFWWAAHLARSWARSGTFGRKGSGKMLLGLVIAAATTSKYTTINDRHAAGIIILMILNAGTSLPLVLFGALEMMGGTRDPKGEPRK